MNKKLMAVAVAAAMAPGLALAQSSVTISGIFKVGVDNIKYSQPAAARTGQNTSETRVTDNSSRIIFNVTEDLGGGMQAIGQLDMRFTADGGALSSAGNTWVGLRGKSWGTVTLGRHDLHYGKQPDDIASKAGALMASSVSLMDSVSPAGTTTQIAYNTRTANVVRYDSPQWGIFNFTAAWSAHGPAGAEADLASTAATGTRKGNAWNLNPQLTGANWQVGYSYWRARHDNAAAASATQIGAAAQSGQNQRGDVLYGFYRWGGFKIGAAWNKSRLTPVLGGAQVSNRTAWTIPASYTWGNHNIYAHYTRANNDKATAAVDDSARMWAMAYVYDLSKRTSMGVTYAKIRNSAGAAYNFFTNGGTAAAAGGLASSNSLVNANEDPRLIAVTVRHAF